MFKFTIRYLGFLKFIPGIAHLFDMWLKIHTFITRPVLLDWMDTIHAEVSKWEGVTAGAHKYGGMQFNYNGKEIGHIHGNGLQDMLLSRQIKNQIMLDGRIEDHHSFKNTGWISFWINTEDDRDYAVKLLKSGYERLQYKSPSRHAELVSASHVPSNLQSLPG